MARVLAEERGLRVVSGRTESHVFLLDLRAKNITGKDDPRPPMVSSGIRIGTPAVTTRGFKEAEVAQLAHWIADVLTHPNDEAVIARTRTAVEEICRRFPVYGR